MVQLTVAANQTFSVYSRDFSGGEVELTVVNKDEDTKSLATVNSITYSAGKAVIDFTYQTEEATTYYMICTVGGVEIFKTLAFATDQATKTPYENINL